MDGANFRTPVLLNKDINSGKAPDGPVAKTYELPTQGGPGSAPGQGTISHMLQLQVRMSQLKTPCVAAKTHQSQTNKYIFQTRDSSLPICSVLWGFLIAGTTAKIPSIMCLRDKALSQEMEPRSISRHTRTTSDHKSHWHMCH